MPAELRLRAPLLAMGLGSWLRPLTDIWPKCLMPVHGRPLLNNLLHYLRDLGVEGLIVNVHSHAKEMYDYLSKKLSDVNIMVTYDRELLGTARSLCKNNHPRIA